MSHTVSRRPYLLRAMHEWIGDSNQTPHIVVDAGVAGVEVPRQYIKDGKIVLNVGYSATNGLQMGNEAIEFNARFGGVTRIVKVPLQAVLAIYSRETGEGMVFSEGDMAPDSAAAPAEQSATKAATPAEAPRRARLTVVK